MLFIFLSNFREEKKNKLNENKTESLTTQENNASNYLTTNQSTL